MMTTAKEAAEREECLRCMHDLWSDHLAKLHFEAVDSPIPGGTAVVDEGMLGVAVASIAMDRGPEVAVDLLGQLMAKLLPLIPEKEESRH